MPKLLLVGCGKMGGALLRGIHAAKLFSAIAVIEPLQPDIGLAGVTWKNALPSLDGAFQPDVVLIAVKPQMIPDVLPSYAVFSKAVFLSIAAGVTIEKLAAILKNPSAAIVRTMPNLPASIGQGMTVAVMNKHVSVTQKSLCDKMLEASGAIAWLDDENLIDAVTALSGSGPAYVFALAETMAKAGEKLGLAPDMAEKLARQTIIGSGALLAQSAESASDLRRAVTSPKGTTEAALQHLLGDKGLDELMQRTMNAAMMRARELAR